MNTISFDLSGKIDQQTVEALFTVKKAADSVKIPFFVIGASARDIILKHCFGIEPPRKTMDIDLGVEVASWEEFKQLTESLVETGKFVSTSMPQRFRFETVHVDIVPFGAVADEHKRIKWPPDYEIQMSLFGFREAYESSITVRLSSDPELDIKLPTLSGLTLMKIVSWKDRYPDSKKDAQDLLLLMQKYEDAGNLDRLFEEESSLLEEEGFDARLASIRLLGRDVASISDPDTLRTIREILVAETREESEYRLVNDMIQSSLSFEEKFNQVLTQVEKLLRGINEASEKKP